MNSSYAYPYRTGAYMPAVLAYYDRADMLATTNDMNVHAHSVCEIMYVTHGHAKVFVPPDTRLSLRAGQYIWLDAFAAHQLMLAKHIPCGMMNIEYDLVPAAHGLPSIRGLYEQDAAFRALLDQPVPFLVLEDRGGALYPLLKQIIGLQIAEGPSHEAFSSMLTSALLLLIAKARAEKAAAESRLSENHYVAEALSMLSQRYGEPVTVKALAGALHLHPTTLHRLFKRYTGQTVNDCLRRIRMEAAAKLLRETAGSVPDTAAAVGIASRQYFTKLFTGTYGVTPSEYRCLHREHQQGGTYHA